MNDLDLDIIKEFVIESSENLDRLDREMVELEQCPGDSELLASIFRTMHTIKGTCGFLDFKVLERITHEAETILSQVRNGSRGLDELLVSLILETVDAIKTELIAIEATCLESGAGYDDLFNRLKHATANPNAVLPRPPKPHLTYATNASPLGRLGEDGRPLDAPATPAGIPAPESDVAIASAKNSSMADSTIRVEVSQLDRLMNLVGELVLARNQLLQMSVRREDLGLNATSQRLNLITGKLQEGVMKTRLQPIGHIWGKLPRLVRDLSSAFGKQIRLEMEGADIELDKTITEAIQDPLIHLVRNSCDHGIERPELRSSTGKPPQGRLLLRAFYESGGVIVEINDDGAGIHSQKVKKSAIEKGLLRPDQAERMSDSELVNLVFLPGFSTAAMVSNISGRGVGMDIVKTKIENIGGAVNIISTPGQGTSVRVRIPLTLASIPGLIIRSGGQRFAIPQASLIELMRVEGAERTAQLDRIRRESVCCHRGRSLPLVFLNAALKIAETEPYQQAEALNIIVVQVGEHRFALAVDEIVATQEIVLKPLGKYLQSLSCYSGATILDDGRVALVLDVVGLAKASSISDGWHAQIDTAPERQLFDHNTQKESLLLFRGGGFERLAVPISLVTSLEEVPRAKFEYSAGRIVIQYRERILPLVLLSEHLGHLSHESPPINDPVYVIVLSGANRRIGLVVDRILDIVEDSVSLKIQNDRTGLLGSAVLGDEITDFLDLQSVIEQAEPGWFEKPPSHRKQPTVMLTEASAFSRSLLRNTLDLAGYRVLEAASPSEAMEKLGENEVDVMIAALDLPDKGAATLLGFLKKDPELGTLPTVALANDNERLLLASAADAGFDEYLAKFDRAGMLRSLEKLALGITEAVWPVEATVK